MDDSIRIHVTSLGCPKNLTDTETVLALIKSAFEKTLFSKDPEDADLILVNTCAFIEDAVSESVETILELSKGKRTDQRIVVFGCLPLRYGRQLEGLLPEVDSFVFHVEPSSIASKILKLLNKKEGPEASQNERVITGRPWQVFVKVSDGCSNRCTYCMIPKIRGNLRCRSPEDIVSEINGAVEIGAREITLVAQDLTGYKRGNTNLVGLVEKILAETEVPWLRLMYLYPDGITNELLRLISSEERICKYLDIPIQHASPRILKRMGRSASSLVLDKTMERIKRFLPDASLRTTVMVGFPGEEEEDFKILLEFIRRWRFHHLGCFIYSDEEEAPSHAFRDKVNQETSKRRKQQIMELQKGISRSINRGFVGKEVDVLVDGYCQESDLLLCGRTRFQAPGVDGITYINKGISEEGALSRVRITQAHDYDLVGEIVD